MRAVVTGAINLERRDDNSSSARAQPPDGGEALVRGTGTAVWSAIERTLADDIATGRFRPGERLPPEQALALRFGVNRHTVRQALGSLATRGLVRTAHGRGSYVAEWAIDYVLGRRTRFSENLAAVGLRAQHRVLEAREITAAPRIARALAVAEQAPLTLLTTAGEAEGRTVSVCEHYFPPRFAGIAAAVAREGSISRALAAFGVDDYTRLRSEITARLPDARTAQWLGQPQTRPVLCVEGINADAAGQPVEFGRTCFGGDRVQLIVAAEDRG
jgi:GntR family phosphonate transport system transcriptional regulator